MHIVEVGWKYMGDRLLKGLMKSIVFELEKIEVINGLMAELCYQTAVM